MTNLKKKVFLFTRKTIIPGGNLGFIENLVDLSSHMETLASEDAQKVIIKDITIWLRTHNLTNVCYFIVPMIVQTAGTFTDTVDIADRIISTILAAAVDDECGYQLLGTPRVAKPIFGNGAAAVPSWIIDTRIVIPKNIINLLNKQVSTERLQELLVGYYGAAITNNEIYVDGVMEISYLISDKGITIR
jgi:hypothetical protein